MGNLVKVLLSERFLENVLKEFAPCFFIIRVQLSEGVIRVQLTKGVLKAICFDMRLKFLHEFIAFSFFKVQVEAHK